MKGQQCPFFKGEHKRQNLHPRGCAFCLFYLKKIEIYGEIRNEKKERIKAYSSTRFDM